MPKVRDAIKLIEADGWRLVTTTGSHRQYKHRTKKGRVTVSGHRRDDVSAALWASIMRQAGISRKANQ